MLPVVFFEAVCLSLTRLQQVLESLRSFLTSHCDFVGRAFQNKTCCYFVRAKPKQKEATSWKQLPSLSVCCWNDLKGNLFEIFTAVNLDTEICGRAAIKAATVTKSQPWPRSARTSWCFPHTPIERPVQVHRVIPEVQAAEGNRKTFSERSYFRWIYLKKKEKKIEAASVWFTKFAPCPPLGRCGGPTVR